MDINLNIHLNITFTGALPVQLVNTDNHPPVQIEPEKPEEQHQANILPKRVATYNVQPKHIAALQPIVTELLKEYPTVSTAALIAKAIKQLKLPVLVDAVHDKITYPSDYKARVGGRMPVEMKRDAAALVVGGVPSGIVSTLCEGRGCLCTDSFKRMVHSISEKDVERVKQKYKDMLNVYGIYDTVSYSDLIKTSYGKTSSLHNKPVQFRKVYTPEQVEAVVTAYQSLPRNDRATIKEDMNAVRKLSGVNACDRTLKKLIFSHTDMQGCENILTPEIKPYLKDGGIYIMSGIIEDKEDYVVDVLNKADMKILEINHMGEWVGIVAQK